MVEKLTGNIKIHNIINTTVECSEYLSHEVLRCYRFVTNYPVTYHDFGWSMSRLKVRIDLQDIEVQVDIDWT